MCRILRFAAKIIHNFPICYTPDIIAPCCAELLRSTDKTSGCLILALIPRIAADFVRFSGSISTVHNRSLPGQHQVGTLPLSCRQVCRNTEGRVRGVMLRNPPDSWGQLGRLRENEGVNSIKTSGRPLYCRWICRSIEGRRSGRHGAAIYPETFGSVLPCK